MLQPEVRSFLRQHRFDPASTGRKSQDRCHSPAICDHAITIV
jgi:hypothetical protein